MILRRDEFTQHGIFGRLTSADGEEEICKTLEHAYQNDDGDYLPKLLCGSYLCVKSVHQLSNGIPFETFEITGLAGHFGILFHVGNWNEDSSGCVLVGQSIDNSCLMRSAIAFQDFMDRLKGLNSFNLIVL